MARAKSKTMDLQKQLEAIKAQIAEAKVAEEAEFGRLARKVGLLDLALSSTEMTALLKSAVDTFRKNGKPSGTQTADTGVEA